MPSEQHHRLVEFILARTGASRYRFMRSLIAELDLDPKDLKKFQCITIVPDAFLIDHDRSEVICYEVDVRTSTDEQRLAPYVNLWWFLEDMEWKLRLFVLRGYQRCALSSELDLFAVSLTWDSSVPIISGSLGRSSHAQEDLMKKAPRP